MTLTLNLSSQAESALRRAFGDALDTEAKLTLAVEAYRRGKLSLGQLAEVLGLDTYAAEGLLKSRGVPSATTLAEIEAELNTLRRLTQA